MLSNPHGFSLNFLAMSKNKTEYIPLDCRVIPSVGEYVQIKGHDFQVVTVRHFFDTDAEFAAEVHGREVLF